MSSQLEVQAFGDLSVEIFKTIKMIEGTNQAAVLLEKLEVLDAEWRKNIGLPKRPQIERRPEQ